MAVELAYIDRPGALPASYTLPPSLSMVLESVSATFNGASAVVPWLACLSFYSQDGKLIGRFPAAQQLAAGDSAEVSFAPLGGDDEGAIHFGTNAGDFLSIITSGLLGIFLEALGGVLTLQSDQFLLFKAPAIVSGPLTVGTPLAYTIRLGANGTGSQFNIDNEGFHRIEFEVDVDTATARFGLVNAIASFVIDNLSGNVLQVAADSTFQYNLQSGAASFLVQDGTFNNILAVNGDTSVSVNGDHIYLQFTNPAQSLTVANSSGTNVFQIQDDGSLHGLTGQTLTFDL